MLGDLSLSPQIFYNDAVTAAVAVKATPGNILSVVATNTTAAVAYLQIFFLASGSVTLGTTVPDLSLRFNANESKVIPLEYPLGDTAGTGITIAGTTTAGGNTTAAISVVLQYM